VRNHFLNEDARELIILREVTPRAPAMQKGGIGIDFIDIRINLIRGWGKGRFPRVTIINS